MDLAGIQRLVEQGEGTTLGFKKSTGELRPAMASLCGMLNAAGRGTVVFGVTDDGAVVGQDFAERTLEEIANESRKLEPKAELTTARLDLPSGKTVVVVEDRAAEAGPFTFDGRACIRVGRTTQRMSRDELQRRISAAMYEIRAWYGWVAPEWRLRDLDLDEVVRMVETAGRQERLAGALGELPEILLRRLKLMTDEGVTRAAAIVFGKEEGPAYPMRRLRLARFVGTTKDEFRDNRQYEGHAFRLLDLAEKFLHETVPIASRFVPGRMARIDIPKFPPLAVREALINALIHRDYSIAGGAVSVAVFDDRLEVWSAGRLPGGLTPEKLKGTHDSVPRNPLVADVFHRRGLIEQWGRGTNKILAEAEGAGCAEPEFEEVGPSFVVRFWPAESTARQDVAVPGQLEARILQILEQQGPLGVQALASRLGPSVAMRTLQKYLGRLRRNGEIVAMGGGRATTYHRSAGGRMDGGSGIAHESRTNRARVRDSQRRTTKSRSAPQKPTSPRDPSGDDTESRRSAKNREDPRSGTRRPGPAAGKKEKRGVRSPPRPRPKPRTRRGKAGGSGGRQ
jgi:ATP-dependent DNA helicase RecG